MQKGFGCNSLNRSRETSSFFIVTFSFLLAEHNKYEPFGDVIWSRSYVETDNNYKFTGKERDKESGLDYFNARYLDHKLGRFMKPDVVQGNIQNPQSLNRFVYCMNNPVKYTDPSGEFPINAIRYNTSSEEILEITSESLKGMGDAWIDTFVGSENWSQTAYEIWQETKSSALNLHSTIAYAPFYNEERQKTWENWNTSVMNIAQTAYDIEHGRSQVDAYKFGYDIGKEILKTEIKIAPFAITEGYLNYTIGKSSIMKGRETKWSELKLTKPNSKHVLFQLEDPKIKGSKSRNVLGLHKPDLAKDHFHLVGRTISGEEETLFPKLKKE